MTKRCPRCKQDKPLSEFSKNTSACKPCVVDRNREYWRTPKGRMSQVYAVQVFNSKERGHPPPAYTREELTAWAFQHGLEALVAAWQAAGFDKNLTPSVDRLDDDKGYSFDNIRLVAWRDNNEKMWTTRKSGARITRQNREVEQLALDGTHIAYYPSIALAARATGAVRSNINAMCTGRNPHIKSVGGFLWRHREEILNPKPKEQK